MDTFIKNQSKFFKKNWRFILFIIYLLSPVDLIPDVVAGAGLLDDLLFFIYVLLEKRKKAVIPKSSAKSADSSAEAVEGEIVKY